MRGVARDGGRYRLNVGVVVFNAEGKVWLGRRAGARGGRSWQFPQGGVDGEEALLDAARRELKEETGVTSVSLIGRAPGWITYDFPPGSTGSKSMKGFVGQTQAWFAFRFTGEESEVDLTTHGPPEFDTWRWEDLERAPDRVVAFKRAAYEEVVEAFRPFAAADPPPRGARGDILMIHGAGTTGRAFDRLAQELRQSGWAVEAPTLAADLRRPEDPPRALSRLGVEALVEEAESWIQAVQRRGRPPVLIGHSFGASLVLKLLRPGRARAAVLINPPPLEGGTATPLALLAGASLSKALLFGRAAKLPASLLRAAVLNCVAADRRGALLAARVYEAPAVLSAMRIPMSDIARNSSEKDGPPVLVLSGSMDRLSPAASAVALVDALGSDRATLEVYPDHGHWMIDEPGLDRVANDLDGWLKTRAP